MNEADRASFFGGTAPPHRATRTIPPARVDHAATPESGRSFRATRSVVLQASIVSISLIFRMPNMIRLLDWLLVDAAFDGIGASNKPQLD